MKANQSAGIGDADDQQTPTEASSVSKFAEFLPVLLGRLAVLHPAITVGRELLDADAELRLVGGRFAVVARRPFVVDDFGEVVHNYLGRQSQFHSVTLLTRAGSSLRRWT